MALDNTVKKVKDIKSSKRYFPSYLKLLVSLLLSYFILLLKSENLVTERNKRLY